MIIKPNRWGLPCDFSCTSLQQVQWNHEQVEGKVLEFEDDYRLGWHHIPLLPCALLVMGSRNNYLFGLLLGGYKWSFSQVELDKLCHKLHFAMSFSFVVNHSWNNCQQIWIVRKQKKKRNCQLNNSWVSTYQ